MRVLRYFMRIYPWQSLFVVLCLLLPLLALDTLRAFFLNRAESSDSFDV